MSLPSQSQLLALSLLSPSPSTNPPPLAPLIHHLLPLFSNPSTASFLFSTSPIHVSLLTAGTILSTSLPFSLQTTRTPVNLFSTHLRATHTNNDVIFVPAFTIDGITLGVGVLQGTQYLIPGFGSAELQVQNFRFVLDANRNLLVMIMDLEQQDCIMVMYSHLLSTKTSHSFSILLKRSPIWTRLSEASVTLHDFQSSYYYYQNEQENRPCFQCGMSFHQVCFCKLPKPKKSHPFCVDAVKHALRMHTGTFHAVVDRVLQGQPNRVYGSRTTFRGIRNTQLVKKMCHLSLTDYLRDKPNFLPRGINQFFTDHIINGWPLETVGGKLLIGEYLIPFQEENQLLLTNETVDEEEQHVDSIGIMDVTFSVKEVRDSVANIPLISERDLSPLAVNVSGVDESFQGRTAAMQKLTKEELKLKEKQERAARRRERNRMSARISNIKRKEREEAMIADLESNKKRIDALKQREMALKRENSCLRNQIK